MRMDGPLVDCHKYKMEEVQKRQQMVGIVKKLVELSEAAVLMMDADSQHYGYESRWVCRMLKGCFVMLSMASI